MKEKEGGLGSNPTGVANIQGKERKARGSPEILRRKGARDFLQEAAYFEELKRGKKQ